MIRNKIILKNVKVHNLKGVNLTLEPNELIVFTGVSGSGKSSLAFDTIYMEGQRRYIESLSSYARRHLGDFPKPDADSIEGISPTIAIEQKTVGKNPRSTVGTITGLYDFIRVLFAKIATPYCPISLEPVSPQSTQKIIETLLTLPKNTRIILLAPFASQKKGEFKEEFLDLQKKGFTKVRVDKEIVDLSEELLLDPTVAHDVDLVIDRLLIAEDHKTRIIEAIETGLDLGKGIISILEVDTNQEKLFSKHAYSQGSGLSYPPLEPQDFSFNHPTGMCLACQGLGINQEFDLTKIIDPEKSLSEDCCEIASSFKTILYGNIYTNLARIHKADVLTPWKDLPKSLQHAFLYGTKEKWTRLRFVHPQKGTYIEHVEWKGVLHEAKERYIAAQSDVYRKKMQPYLHEATCSECLGSRIKPYPSAARLGSKKIHEITALSIQEALLFFKTVKLDEMEIKIGEELIKETIQRLGFLERVGLGYLSLDRPSPSLSGGEGQRVRLASQIGSGLVGATYILDEPSIGLHPRDNKKLLETLLELKNNGNTVIVVEHDEETILSADTIIDVGPLAGKNGGRIVAEGSLKEILESKDSLTGGYLSGRLPLPSSQKREKKKGEEILLCKASHHNLKEVSLSIPLGLFISVTGVSGSGKSSLILDTLYPALSNKIQGSFLPVGAHERIEGIDKIDKIIAIDQSSIGKTPRSNPATYIKLFDEIRDLFTQLPESLSAGFAAGRFSFNVKEGCCPFCLGMGMIKVDMDFLADEWSVCEHCKGKRFDDTTLAIRFKGKNIHDILEMSIEEAYDFFAAQPKIRNKLDLLMRVGLDYIKLGQPSPTLSGGEAQRIKLAKELSRPSTGKTLFILDEPTTGLHFHDIKQLIAILQSLVDKGNTVLVIEHNMDCVKTSDWIIDLGPEAGPNGGQILAEGTPLAISKKKTATGIALKAAMEPKKPLTKIPVSHVTPPLSHLTVTGASQNNLKNLDASIPLGSITVCTGPSGSGKSSFAFETIYAEGQRRYIESMSHYARQFVKQMPKPKVEQIEGLSAAIAIEQKNHAGNPRSTVGTMTEIYDYLRILYSHLGTPFCPETGEEIKSISKDYVVDKAMELPLGSKCFVLCPITLSKQDTFEQFQEKMIKQGFLRIRLNNTIFELEDTTITWDRKKKNALFLVIDRLVIAKDSRKRLNEAIEQALRISQDKITLATDGGDLSFNLSCTVQSTGKSYPPVTAHTFSFNTDVGMCPDCLGLGFQYGTSYLLTQKLSTLTPLNLIFLLCKENLSRSSRKLLSLTLSNLGIDPDTSLSKLSKESLLLFFEGQQPTFDTLPPLFAWKGLSNVLSQYAKSSHGNIRSILSSLLEQRTCFSCEGTRLSPLARNVKIQGTSIADLVKKEIGPLLSFLNSIAISEEKRALLQESLIQIFSRLDLLQKLGLGYLSLDRSAPTLSGGETQRIRLSRQLGSGLTGCLYVLDEPTIGLHPFDNHLLNQALLHLKNLGNTLVLVEHDPLTMQIADYILDFGPGAGKLGGQILARGSLKEILKNKNSLTGAYLSGTKTIPIPTIRRTSKEKITLKNISLHNLKDISASIPIRVLTCLTGVSGSGKSTLLLDIIRPQAEKAALAKRRRNLAEELSIEGLDAFDKVIVLDQNPIGTTSRADISTYTELLTPIRHLYSSLPEAKMRGLQPKHFSYNHRKGMCSTCQGLGVKTISLQFLPSIKVECESCKGHRLNPLALQVTFKGKHFGELLKLSVEQAQIFFSAFPKIVKILDTLISVGLPYLMLGQEIASLSGGESQRLRLSCELAKRSTGKTLYLFDEPSIGLHSLDIEKIIPIFHNLVDKGNTVILIEHHLDLISQCDHIIDIGPGAGPEGGSIIAEGTPEEVANSPDSRTAPFLKQHLRQTHLKKGTKP